MSTTEIEKQDLQHPNFSDLISKKTTHKMLSDMKRSRKQDDGDTEFSTTERFLTKGAFLLTPSYDLSVERAALICEKMTFKGCFSLTKTATGILFKFSNPDDYQSVFKKGFHKITGARFHRKIVIPCRPRKTFTLYVLDVPEDLPVEDVRHSLYRFNSVVEVVRLYVCFNPSLMSSEKSGDGVTQDPNTNIDRPERKDLPSAVIRVTLASMEEYNVLLKNGLNFYDATFFPTESCFQIKGAKIDFKRRLLDANISGRIRELPVFDAAGFCKISPPAVKYIKPLKA